MATFTLSQINNSTGGSKRTLASSAPAAALNYSVQASQQVAESQNNGGILGGVGYLFEKVGLGFLSGIEGIWDYGAGGIAKLFGADDWAEQQFANDWVNYNDADEWFNPSDGWRVAGDVAGGIGTSLPAIAGTAAGAAIAYFSGGTLSPLAAGIISGSIAGFGAAGNATKEAYYETGNLGAKEFGYGFLSGATEAGVEFLSAGLAKGTGRIVSSIAKSTAKETAETVAKTGAKSVIKNLLSDFAQEAFEEGLSEILSPVYQRMTYNPDAENATPQEVAYAALVGGLSGLVMSGGSMATSAAINTTQNLFSGNRAIENGTVDSVMETARQLTETENANDTGYASFQTVKSAYEQLSQSLKTTGGTVQTVKQKMLLGQIKRANTASIFMPFIERSAVNILANAESVAQRYTEFGMKDANGKLLTFTAEDIRSGVDESLLQIAPQERTKEQQKALVKSIRTALTSNSTLSTLAVADATGHITMDTQRFAEASLNGVNLANSADLNYFVEHASKEQIAALSEDLGISDWSALTIDDFRTKVSEFATSEKISEYANQSKRIRAAMQMAQENTKSIPHILRRNMADGVYRFSSENSTVNMAIFKEGETYHLFDYDSGNISRSLSVQEVNKVLRDYWKSETVQTPTVEQFTEETNLGKQTLAIDELATAKIPEYHTLSEPNKQAVRMTMRQAQAHGIAEAETLTFARVAARSGLNIVFDGVKSAIGDANIQGNTIYINPDAPTERLQSRLLLHEAGHALLRGKNGKNLIVEAFKHIAPERSQKIAQQYIDFYREYGFSAEQYMPIVNEEITTAYIEDILGDTNAWEYILSEEPSISQKILSFFRKAAQDYSGDAKLSAEARKLLRTYKKLFAELSAQNQGNNALELTRQDEITKKPVTSTKNENVQVTDNSPRITSGMSDDERYEVLKDKNITISAKTDRTKLEGVMSKLDITESNLDLSKYGDKKRLFKKLGEEFGVFKQYNNPDTKVTFSFSKGGMSESVSKQRKGYMRLAKLLTCIDSVIENAVGIETHNRNDKGYKVDTSLKNVYVLASAFVDGENIIPVKLEVKEFSDKENTLYVAIALESIKKNEIVKQEVATNGVAQQYSPSFNISIADFLRKINPSDESFYKYIPKKLLETSKDGNGQVLNVKSNDSPQPTSKTLLDGITAKSTTSRAADIADHDGSTFEGKHNFTEEISAPIASASDNSIADSAENVNTNSENGNKNMPKERFALKIGDAEVSTKGRYQFETDTETLLRDISEQNSIEHFMPEGLSADFQKAIQRSNGFAFPRLYRGMEAAELDYIVQNGFIKSNSSYNFSYQQDQTRFSPNIQTALSYATGFAPSGIREKFFEQGMPAYIVEVGNYANLDFINEDAIESYTKKNVDVKYITRIIELKFDAEANKVKASDIQIDGMNQAKGELLHGVPSFAQDKVTGTILYKHQGADGFEDGKYISEKRPDILFDYDLVEAHKDMDFDYNRYLGISGDPTNLVDYQYPLEKRFALAETNSNGETLTEQQKEYFKDSHAKDGQGRLLVLYHQTDTDFTEFNTQHEGASARDNETPHGIFLKPTNGNIGLKGNKQMRLYANITNPLKFYTRTDAQQYWKRNIDGYADILAQIAVNDRVYNEQFDEVFDLDGLARKRRNAELSEMRREEIDALYEESEIESQKILDEWEEANTVLDKKAKILIDEYLKDNGYDGVFLLEDQGSFGRKVQTYIALSAEQVKNTDNATPTVSKDIRFSLPEIDSDGNTISAEQRKYFSNTKVVDEQGRLLTVYHGSPKTFTEFSHRFMNTHGNAHGRGFYFTEDMNYAEGYRKDGGQLLKGYLDINKPASETKTTMRKAELVKLIKATCEAQAKELIVEESYGNMHDALLDTWISNYVNTYDAYNMDSVYKQAAEIIFNNCDNDVDILAELTNGGAGAKSTLSLARKVLGYDGIIYDNGDGTHQFVAFESNQFKNATNANPTDSQDIRYALPDIDSNGNSLSAGQREYFADSKVLDDNGNLLLVYHGTRKADFTEFRRNVNYFTDSMEMADSYSPNGEKYAGYLNISNPYVIDAEGERWSRIPIDAETKQFLDEYGSSTFKEDGAWRTTPADIAAAIEEAVDTGEMDYDGIIIRNVDDTGSYSKNGKTVAANDYIVFNSNQFKNADNINPTTDSDIRYALQDEYIDEIFSDGTDTSNSEQDATFDANAVVARGMPRKIGKANMTIGELRKVVANNTKQKVYSKTDALSVVNKFTGISDLTQKTRTEIADAVWQILNEAPDIEYRRDVAHDMAEFIVAKILVDAKTENAEAQTAQERLSYFRTGIGKLTFSEEDISEIRHVRDKKGLKQVLGRWGYKGTKSTNGIVSSKRTPMDMFVVDIAREMPAMEHLEDMHPVDAFLEIDAMYEQAQAEAKDKWISKYWDMPDSEIPSMIKNIENEIMSAYETEGTQSKFSKRFEGAVSYYKEQAEYWKAEHDKIKGRDRLLGQLMNQAQKMKDLKLGTFANSTQHDSAIFKNSIEQLARTQFRGNLNVSGTRKILSNLRQWYTSDTVKTGILGYVDASNTGLYVQGVTDMLETLSEGKKGFTKDDLKMLCDVMSYFTKFVENWGKVFRQGKWIEAKPEAERYINTLHANESLKVGLFGKMTGTLYMQTFGDPMTVARRMDRYESGFYTEMTTELRNAATDAQVAEMEIRSAYDDFTNQHKNYVKKASVETVTYRGTEISKMHLIGLYMTMKRKHAWAGLAANGFTFIDGNSKRVRVNGVISPDAKITNAELRQYTTEQLSAIEALLTDTDKEYVAILEQAFNVDARKLKADRDIQRLGFTNATDDYYYPIRRGNIAKNVDTADMASELDRVSNSSFNKDTVRGAKQELFIESADTVFNRHIHAVCQYAYLSPAVEAYNRLYNLDVSGNPNKPISVATESANTWAKGNKYFAKLIADIQGIPATSSEGMRVLGYIRGSYAKFQLGANPKVWITQLSSLFASSSLLDADSIMRGMTVSAQGIDEYCSLAKLRNYDSTATMAQGVLDSKTKRAVSAIGKFNDALMIPIGKMDRFVVRRLFGACQVQVEKNGGARIGTDANKIEAGKMLRQVILETQQNSIATERSAAMRSGNELLRTVTMFTADSMKVIGRVIDSIGEASTIKSKLKITTDTDARSLLKQQLKIANRKVRKSVGALTLSAVFMASVAQMFRWLYNKDQDEDESIAETMLVDAVGNLIGGLPLFKDAYSKIFEGYDVDNYAYSAINDLLDSALNVFEVAGNALTNEGSTQDRNRAVRNLAYSVGQLLGVPVRNVYNVLYGLTKRFDPETAYVIDSALYKKNYQNELYQAIENDDAEKTSLIMSLLLGERLNDNVDEAVFNELLILSKNGQKVILRNIPSSITIDGVEYPISAAEQTAIKNIYTTSEKSLKTLFAKSKYNSLSDEQKAEAIDYIYDTYYDKALEDALGIDRNNSSLAIADVVGVDNLALLYVGTKGLTSDTDKRGNIISGSKRKKVVEAINSLGISTEKKLLLICAKGYSLQDNDIRGLSATKAKKYLLRYILSLKGKTSAEKAEIAELCGFEVVNGKIITKNL